MNNDPLVLAIKNEDLDSLVGFNPILKPFGKVIVQAVKQRVITLYPKGFSNVEYTSNNFINVNFVKLFNHVLKLLDLQFRVSGFIPEDGPITFTTYALTEGLLLQLYMSKYSSVLEFEGQPREYAYQFAADLCALEKLGVKSGRLGVDQIKIEVDSHKDAKFARVNELRQDGVLSRRPN